MGLVLWIDQNTFSSSMVEKVYKQMNLPFYSLADVKDFAYLIDDLKPVVIVIERETVLKNMGSFQQQYSSSGEMKKLPFIVIGGWKDLEIIENKKGELQLPFNPFEVPSLLGKML